MLALIIALIAIVGGFWILVGLAIASLAVRVMVGEALRAIGLSIKSWFIRHA